jgi:hypothetical protein
MSAFDLIQKDSYRFRIFTNDYNVKEYEVRTFADDPDEVWHQAAMSSCDMLRDLYGRVTPGLDWRMEVSDGNEKCFTSFHSRQRRYEVDYPICKLRICKLRTCNCTCSFQRTTLDDHKLYNS